MMKATITHEFVIPPECAGQIVTHSYGIDSNAEVIVEKIFDGSDRSVKFLAYEFPENDSGEWSPWNGTPELGECRGECLLDENQ